MNPEAALPQTKERPAVVAPARIDVAIIGAGQAAEPAAEALADAGRKIALVEAQHLGGPCVSFGRSSAKAVLAATGPPGRRGAA